MLGAVRTRSKKTTPRGAILPPPRKRASRLSAAFALVLIFATTATPATAATEPPGAPLDVQATPGDGEATVDWLPPAEGGGDISGYTVSADPGPATATTSGNLTAIVDGLTNDVAYTFTVVATNNVSDGPASDPSAPTTPTADIVVNELSETLTADDLVANLVGEGVSPEDETYTGDLSSSGTFSSGAVTGLDQGVLLTTGQATDVIGPNLEDASNPMSAEGDSDLDALIGGTTHDASVLEFSFTPTTTPVYFSYAFSSEEYNEYVNTQYNDVFAFFVNGSNCALVSGTEDPVSINTVNGGNPFGQGTTTNPDLYRNNDWNDPGPATLNTQMDGLTDVLTCQADVNPEVSNTMKLAIADTNDSLFDSAVFLEAGSFSTTPQPPGAPTDVQASPGDGEATVTWQAPLDPGSTPISSYTVTATPGPATATTPDGATTSATVVGLTNGQSYTFQVHATNDAGDGPPSAASNSVTPQAEIPPSADLSVAQDDNPDPVNGGNKLQYLVTVSNLGPDTAPNTTIVDIPDPLVNPRSAKVLPPEGGGDFVAAAAPGFCTIDSESDQIECNVGDLAPGDSATVAIVVDVPNVEVETVITNQATVSSDVADPDDFNDQSSEETTVQPSNPQSDSGFIPPRGGTLTTDPGAGATPTDPTVFTMIVPAGPGGEASVAETAECQDLLEGEPFTPCLGALGDFVPPPGYERVRLKLIYDRSIVSGDLRDHRKPWVVLYQKLPDETILELPRCADNGDVEPCVLGFSRTDPERDLRANVAISSDPRLATRK